MKKILSIVFLVFTVLPLFSMSGTYRVKVGETFTVYATPRSYTQACAWLWGGNVVPVSDIYGTTSTVTFKAISATPTTAPCSVQCTTYYFQNGTTSSGLNKDIEYWNVFVEEENNGNNGNNGNGDNTGSQGTLSLNYYEYTMSPGEQFWLRATAQPAPSTYNWRVNDPSGILRVYDNGNEVSVFGDFVGMASISCTANGVTKTCYVTVKSNSQDGVEKIEDDTDMSCEGKDCKYYNLQGIEVNKNNLQPGIYIKITGNRKEKLLISNSRYSDGD